VNSAYLRLRNLIKSYDGKTAAVDNVSIDIKRGEFLTWKDEALRRAKGADE